MINVDVTVRAHDGEYFLIQNIEIKDIDAFLYSLWDRLNNKEADFILINQSLLHKPSIKYVGVAKVK